MAQLRDIYLSPESDPAYRPDQLEVYDEIESTLQQIKMTLFTRKGEVLGDYNFGLEVDKYLFEFSIDPFILSREAQNQIDVYVLESKKRTIAVSPASYSDERAGREIFVLLIDIPELKTPLSVFYD